MFEDVRLPALLEPVLPKRQAEVMRELDESGAFNMDYLLLVMLSCIIATFGLVQNSAAVIIGAMLIAPLMSPIARCALALVCGDLRRVWRAAGTLIAGVVIAIVLSTIFGLVVSYSNINLFEQLPSEILSRTQPNLFDLVVALAGGAAVAYALARPQLSAALPGVAIATALMPPLCTVGIGLALGQMTVSGGALLLFLVNMFAIVFSTSLVFIVLGFRPLRRSRSSSAAQIDSQSHRLFVRRVLLLEGVLLLIVMVPLTLLTIKVVQEAQQDRIIRTTLSVELAKVGDVTLVGFERTSQPTYLQIVATIRAPRSLTYKEAVHIQSTLAFQLQQRVALQLVVVPVTILDPLVPPTPTPTPIPTATATATATAPATAPPTPTVMPTVVVTP